MRHSERGLQGRCSSTGIRSYQGSQWTAMKILGLGFGELLKKAGRDYH